VLGKRSATADTDLRLARYFGLSDGFFLGLQAD
jgi:plasmid maintenance system antidote protein VapI